MKENFGFSDLLYFFSVIFSAHAFMIEGREISKAAEKSRQCVFEVRNLQRILVPDEEM